MSATVPAKGMPQPGQESARFLHPPPGASIPWHTSTTEDIAIDTGEMKELLRGYLGEMDMTAGLTKDAILGHLAGRDEALRTMVNEYLPEGSYQGVEVVSDEIPAQAWQDVQGDRWAGSETQYVENTDSNFGESGAGQS